MKKIVGLAILASITSSAQAANLNQDKQDNLKVTLSGKLNTQMGYIKSNKFFNYKASYDNAGKISGPPSIENGLLNNRSIVNDTSLTIKTHGDSENLKYGGEIKLNTNTSSDKDEAIANRTMIFIETDAGRVEVGSYNGATDNMKVSALNLAKATGGIDGDWVNWMNPVTSNNDKIKTSYILGTYLPVGSEYTSKANKITYYTPTFNDFQLGFSYIPDIKAKGTVAQARSITKEAGADRPYGFRNIIETGIKYESEILDDTKVAASILYQNGVAKQNASLNIFRKNLNAWEIGALIKHEGFGIAGSYGDWGKSGTNKNTTASNKYRANFWNLGVSYEYDKFGTSITYYKAKRANDSAKFFKTEILSFGIDYKIADGLMPYIEANKVKLTPGDQSMINKSNIYLMGVVLKF